MRSKVWIYLLAVLILSASNSAYAVDPFSKVVEAACIFGRLNGKYIRNGFDFSSGSTSKDLHQWNPDNTDWKTTAQGQASDARVQVPRANQVVISGMGASPEPLIFGEGTPYLRVNPTLAPGGLRFYSRSLTKDTTFWLDLRVKAGGKAQTYRAYFKPKTGFGDILLRWSEFKLVDAAGNPVDPPGTLDAAKDFDGVALGVKQTGDPDGHFGLEIEGPITVFRSPRDLATISPAVRRLAPEPILTKLTENLYNPVHQQEALDIVSQGDAAVDAELKRIGLAGLAPIDPGFESPNSFFDRLKNGYVPRETGTFGTLHGELSHAAQTIAMTRGMSPEELKAFVTFYRALSADRANGWQAWDLFWDGPGPWEPNGPGYWAQLFRDQATMKHAEAGKPPEARAPSGAKPVAARTQPRSPETLQEDAEARAYVEKVKQELAQNQKDTNARIVAAQAAGHPLVLDSLGIGAGPHMAIFMATMKIKNPEMRTMLFEALRSYGTFDTLKGFDVNTQELPQSSGNTFPGIPIQPRDLNFAGDPYVLAETFGQVTALGHYTSGVEIATGQRVMQVELVPPGGPAKFLVTTQTGAQVYTNEVIAGTGFGRPVLRSDDPNTLKIAANEAEKAWVAKQRGDHRFASGLQSVDDFTKTAGEDAAHSGFQGDPIARYAHDPSRPADGSIAGDFGLIGGADGGNIAAEIMARLNASLDPKASGPRHVSLWFNQDATTGAEFLAKYKDDPNRLARYGRIAQAIDDGRIISIPGYVKTIEEVPGRVPRHFKVTVQKKASPGSNVQPKPEVYYTNYNVHATGYENDVSDIFEPVLSQWRATHPGSAVMRWVPVMADPTEYTRYPQLEREKPIGMQLTIFDSTGSHPLGIYAAGPAAQVPVAAVDWKTVQGGSLDLLGARTGALAAQLTPEPPAKPGSSLTNTVECKQGCSGEIQIPRSTRKFDSVVEARLETKIRISRMLEKFRVESGLPFGINVSSSRPDSPVLIEVLGLDAASAAKVQAALAHDPSVLDAIDCVIRFGYSRISVRSAARGSGLLRPEDLSVEIKP